MRERVQERARATARNSACDRRGDNTCEKRRERERARARKNKSERESQSERER